jgi:dienelactone hydrolase
MMLRKPNMLGLVCAMISTMMLTSACQAQPTAQPAKETSPGSSATAATNIAKNLTLTAADGGKIFAKYYDTSAPKALILAFHQAGSNKAEYATIAPRLVKAGYSVLAIDQRSGGSMFGGKNETIAARGKSTGYRDGKIDMEAALAWAQDKGVPVIIWGSSYSAALSYVLAAENPGKVAALLSFSGGDYFPDVKSSAAKLTIPIFATSDTSSGETGDARAIQAVSPSRNKVQFIPKLSGKHGSQTLIAEKNPKGAEENWAAVLAFLKSAIS